MLIIRKEQMDELGRYMGLRFEARMASHLRSRFKEHLQDVEEEKLQTLIRQGIERAKLYKVLKQKDLRRYLECMIEHGTDFDTNSKTSWATCILRNLSLSGTQKMDRIDNYQTYVMTE